MKDDKPGRDVYSPSIFFHYLQEYSIIQLYFINCYNVITAYKLATTEYGADAFFKVNLLKYKLLHKSKGHYVLTWDITQY